MTSRRSFLSAVVIAVLVCTGVATCASLAGDAMRKLMEKYGELLKQQGKIALDTTITSAERSRALFALKQQADELKVEAGRNRMRESRENLEHAEHMKDLYDAFTSGEASPDQASPNQVSGYSYVPLPIGDDFAWVDVSTQSMVAATLYAGPTHASRGWSMPVRPTQAVLSISVETAVSENLAPVQAQWINGDGSTVDFHPGFLPQASRASAVRFQVSPENDGTKVIIHFRRN